jgi:hypothetical protein
VTKSCRKANASNDVFDGSSATLIADENIASAVALPDLFKFL